MSFNFFVIVNHNDSSRAFEIKDTVFTVGSDYKNSVVLPISKSVLKLIELKEDSLYLYPCEDIKTLVYANDRVYELSELLKLLPNSKAIRLKTHCKLIFKIEDYELTIEVKERLDEVKRTIPKDFQKRFLTKENINFVILICVISSLLFSITGFSAYYFKKFEPIMVKKVETAKTIEEREIGYVHTEKRSPSSLEEKSEKIKGGGDKTIKGEGKGIKEVPKGAFIASAPIEAPKQGGILAVEGGARSVYIKRERSLFSKLEETLDVTQPIKDEKGGEEVKSFQSAKVEDIHPGPSKKEIKVGLEETEKLRPQEKPVDIKVVVGKRPETEITSTLSKYKKGFEFIFIDMRKKDPELKGKVVLFFVVENSGKVSKAEIIETDIKNQEFLDKILTLVKSIKFPPSDKGETSIKLPLLFFPTS